MLARSRLLDLLENFIVFDESRAGTVRKVVDDLVAAKKVKSLGPDPDHASRGRAPNLFTAA